MLLEILLSIALIGMCVVPLVRNPLFFARKEIQEFKTIELQRLADLAFAEVKTKLYNQEIPWEKLSSHREEEKKVSVFLNGFGEEKFTRKISFFSKQDLSKIDHVCPHVHISFSSPNQKKIFTYQVYVSIERGHGDLQTPHQSTGKTS